jgi:MFS family permease
MSWLADRRNRRNILAASMIAWSGFTALCGLSRTYWQFLAARIGVGIGETGGTPRKLHHRGLFSGGPPSHGARRVRLGAPIGAVAGRGHGRRGGAVPMAGARHSSRSEFRVIVGTIIYLTIREPPAGAWTRCPIPRRRRSLEVPAIPIPPKSGISCSDGFG